MKKYHIVIVGAGFGGVYTALNLVKSHIRKDIKITLIDRNDHLLFTPILHEVATGSLSPSAASVSLRKIFASYPQVTVVNAEVSETHCVQKCVHTSLGDFDYDSLVLATGTKATYYGVQGADKYSIPLKQLDNAETIKQKILQAFNDAAVSKSDTDKKEMLSFVIVGAGPTGVEFAADLSDYIYGTLAKVYKKHHLIPLVTISLISTGGEVLSRFHPVIQAKAEQVLHNKKVIIKFNSRVEAVTENGVQLQSETGAEEVLSRTVIWSAGVTPQSPYADVEPHKRIAVTSELQVIGQKDVYALGDVAEISDAPDPMLAQVAMRQGKIVAHNIVADVLLNENYSAAKKETLLSKLLFKKRKKRQSFNYEVIGKVASLGDGNAVGDINGLHLSGFVMKIMWKVIYIMKFPTMKGKMRLMHEWFMNIFHPRNTVK